MRKLFLIIAAALAASSVGNFVAAKAWSQVPAPKNILVCGDASTCPFQRGVTSATVTNTAVTHADWWTAIAGASSALVVSQSSTTAVPGYTKAHRMQRTAANANTAALNYGQVLDADRSIQVAGKMVCLSFNALAGATYSPTSAAFVYTVTFGTGSLQGYASMVAGTWTGTGTVLTGTATLTTTFQPVQKCAQVPATATEVGVNFSWTPVGTAGATDFVDFNGVQLEVVPFGGTPQPTTFEARSALSERFFAQQRAYLINEPAAAVNLPFSGTSASATSCIGPLPFPTTMRAAPTLTASAIVAGTNWMVTAAGVAANTSAVAVIGAHTANNASLNWTTSGMTAGQACVLQGKGGTATLLFSADLP